IKLCPAVVAWDISFSLIRRQRESNLKASGDAGSAHHPDKQGVKIGAVATLGGARPYRVSPAPTLARLVVAHRGHDVVVHLPRLCQCVLRALCFLPGEL